jgi:D-glycero-alpha-D-manno-heptose-7-phosphate kinase
MIIRARAPLRLGLAGGGTDVSPYCDIHGGYVLNAAIDRYAYTVIKSVNKPQIRFVATDQQVETVSPANVPLELNGRLDLHKAVYNYIVQNFNGGVPISLELSTFCDAPAGSGLGSSSTLVVTMIRAFGELLNLPLDDYLIAKMAYQIERVDCGLQGGRQDQYSATFGGFNFMEFYASDRAIINPLRIKNWIICELEASLLLYFTGVSRESSNIIADQSNNVRASVVGALEAMHGIKSEALTMKECLLRGDFSGLIESVRAGWENKKRSAKTVSNFHIDSIYDAAMQAGALAGKISGAGGGGFMWFFVPTEKRMDVVRVLNSFGGSVSNCHFTKYGTQAWRIG